MCHKQRAKITKLTNKKKILTYEHKFNLKVKSRFPAAGGCKEA